MQLLIRTFKKLLARHLSKCLVGVKGRWVIENHNIEFKVVLAEIKRQLINDFPCEM